MQPPPAHQPNARPDARTLQAAAADVGLVLPDAALDAFREGRMIEAIKRIRTANPGLDLARAKAAMEYLQRVQRTAAGVGVAAGRAEDVQPRAASAVARDTRPPTVEQGDPPGQLRWLLIVLGLLGLGIWFVFGGMSG